MLLKRLLRSKIGNDAKAENAAEPVNPPASKLLPDAFQSSKLINRIGAHCGFDDYLEVGVQNGITFHEVKAARRDAVDPNFLFEVSGYENSSTRFYSMMSDDFFVNYIDKTYDLIFLDGRHTFEQCYRDFCAALQVLREPGVIIIDDTVPGDFFSAMATQEAAIAARAQHGLTGRAWTGDVFKVVLALRDFYPNLDYATLRDPEDSMHKSQTLVWRAPRKGFSPLHDDMGAIVSAGFFDLPGLASAFNYISIEDGLARLFAAKSGA